MKKLVLRQAKPEDVEEMCRLFVDTIHTVCDKDYNEEQRRIWVTRAENKEVWLNKVRDEYVLLAESSENLVGFSALRANDYLDLLYVHKDYQRKGIARILCHFIEKEALRRNGTIMYSDVSITAKPFFEKNGYHLLQEQKNVINNVEIVNYRMCKDLSTTKPVNEKVMYGTSETI